MGIISEPRGVAEDNSPEKRSSQERGGGGRCGQTQATDVHYKIAQPGSLQVAVFPPPLTFAASAQVSTGIRSCIRV